MSRSHRFVDDPVPVAAAEHGQDQVKASTKHPRTRTDRLRRQNLAMDRAGVPCACDDKTPCLAHQAISGRRRWLRPSNAKGKD